MPTNQERLDARRKRPLTPAEDVRDSRRDRDNETIEVNMLSYSDGDSAGAPSPPVESGVASAQWGAKTDEGRPQGLRAVVPWVP